MIGENFGKSSKYDNFEEVLFGNILRTADEVFRSIDSFLTKNGVSLLQYNVLRSIRERGENGAPIGVIGQEMLTFVPDMTRLIDRMEKKKLVKRVRNSEDRRSVFIHLTPKGLKIANEPELELVTLHKSNFDCLSRKEQQLLKQLLFRVRQNLKIKREQNEN
ncbi:MAG: MarR family transcriptional regulator [Calditrichaeota bacterium]|nr:MarR family transcriptional regulator [Calditrichota bacterium]